MFEQQLPFGSLYLSRDLLVFGIWIFPGVFAKIDEPEGIPINCYLEGLHARVCIENVLGSTADPREYGMGSDISEPVGSVRGIGLLTMHNAVPEASFGRGNILRD
jgi:hypothetical protein